MSPISDRTARRIAAERVPTAATFASTGAITPDLLPAIDAAISSVNGAPAVHVEELRLLRDYVMRAGARERQDDW